MLQFLERLHPYPYTGYLHYRALEPRETPSRRALVGPEISVVPSNDAIAAEDDASGDRVLEARKTAVFAGLE